jgi:putative chitinase
MPITLQQLLKILPSAGKKAGVFESALGLAMDQFKINTPLRMAAFIAQVGHESMQLTKLRESLNYRADRIIEIGNASKPGSRWRSLVPRAAELAGSSERMGNAVYGGRLGNGPESSGDGFRFLGRGLIQVTGKANYLACGEDLGIDLVNHPELLEQPQYAAMSAGWFWSANGLSALADYGALQAITQKINGGLAGNADRVAIYDRALKVLA